jgi:hypothetical protein
MPEGVNKPKRRTCPHCGKEIPKLTKLPRDLGLLLNVLLYRVPHEQELTEDWIEVARKHCKMRPERLAELRTGDHARHWPRMLERRAARLAYFKQHGKLPPRWAPLLPGERDHRAALAGLRRYRKGGLAKLKARMRKRPVAAADKLVNRYLATRRLRSPNRKSAALDDLAIEYWLNRAAQRRELSLGDYELFRAMAHSPKTLPPASG